MSIPRYLEELRNFGVELRLEKERLICNFSKGCMTSEMLAEIKNKKAEIISFLKEVSHSKWSPIVVIQPHGRRPPFFCFHGIGGNVLNYRVLPTYLGCDQPLYGLQSRGLDGKSPPFRNIKPMALYYLSAIIDVQPKGPYYLGGGSMGGMVAFETAKQLQLLGNTIGLLIMFDTIGPNVRLPYYNLLQKINKILKNKKTDDFKAFHSKLLTRGIDKINHYRKLAYCERIIKQNKIIPYELRFWFVEQMNINALSRYRASTYNGEIVVLKGAHENEGIYNDPERGWHGVAKKGLRIIEVPGCHASLVEEPILGEELAKCLQQAQMEKEI